MSQSTSDQTPLPALASSPPNDKPIDWHYGLVDNVNGWAQRISMEPSELRLRVASAIRTRGHEAIIKRDSHRAAGKQPNVFWLWLDGFGIYFTNPETKVVIRGFGFQPQTDDPEEDLGGFFCDFAWHQPISLGGED